VTYRILPFGPTPHRVRVLSSVMWWPKGLRWFSFVRRSSINGRDELRASYTIRSRGRTGARDRQRLMACPRHFHINALHREDR
jgi:hypothetical protein